MPPIFFRNSSIGRSLIALSEALECARVGRFCNVAVACTLVASIQRWCLSLMVESMADAWELPPEMLAVTMGINTNANA